MAIRFDSVPLTQQSDIELAARFQDGDDAALDVILERYRRFARSRTRGYFLMGADSDDIEQEAMIGLFKATRDFRPDRDASFRAFADLCVTRQVLTAVKAATRRKHEALNQYVSIFGTGTDDATALDADASDVLHDHTHADPADEIVSREGMASMSVSISEMLSRLEVAVLHLHVEGKTYQEIGALLGRHAKSIDNALQRIRRKLDAHLLQRAANDAEAYAIGA